MENYKKCNSHAGCRKQLVRNVLSPIEESAFQAVCQTPIAEIEDAAGSAYGQSSLLRSRRKIAFQEET